MKTKAISSGAPRPLASYTEAMRAGDFVFAAGQLASDFSSGVPDGARVDPAFPYYGSDIKRQTEYILANLATTLEAAGTGLDNVVKAQVFMTDLHDFHGFDEVWKSWFETPPPRTTVGTTGLLVRDTRVEIDLIAYVPRRGLRAEVVGSAAPSPLANYTEAMRVGDLVFAAGQLASDFETGIPARARLHPAFPYYGMEIKKQAEYILENLAVTFEAAGTSLDNIVKSQVFLTDLRDFAAFDEVWKAHFKSPPPRTTVGTSGLLVKDTRVEIDLIGYVPRPGVKAQTVKSAAPAPLASYAEAFKLDDWVFAAGQIASDYQTGVPPRARIDPAFPYYGSEIKRQTEYVLENLTKTFAAAGSSLDHVVKAQVFLADLGDFNGFDEVWKSWFETPPPRTTIGTTGLLVKDTRVEIDLIGVID